jgi:hypothetical protein
MAYLDPLPIIPGKNQQAKANAYVILDTDFLNSVDFTKIFGRPETLRYNTDRDKFIVKYSGTLPSFLTGKTTYSKDEIMAIIEDVDGEWYTEPIE